MTERAQASQRLWRELILEKRGSWQRKTKTCPASDTREARLISSTASGHAIDKDD